MIPGEWLARLGARIARKETFEHMVSPAIADMQFESRLHRHVRWRHCLGLVVVLTRAFLHDLRLDVATVVDSEARRVAWKNAGLWFLAFATLFTLAGLRDYRAHEALKLDGLWPTALTSAGLAAAIAAVQPGMIAAVVYLYRKSDSLRAVVMVILTVAVLTSAFAMLVRPIRMSANQQIHNAVSPRAGGHPDELNPLATWWQAIQSGVQVIPHALLGIVLARRRGWNLAFTIPQFFATWIILIAVLRDYLFGDLTVPAITYQRWREIALNCLVAIIWLSYDGVKARLSAPRGAAGTTPPISR